MELTSDLLAGNPLVPIGYEKRDSLILIDGDPERTGIQGELIIVGDHVSTGYFNNEEQNRARFFTWQGKRAFRTGDLGYYRGNLLYLTGRNDGMIKFHGYRIERSEFPVNQNHKIDRTRLIRDYLEPAMTNTKPSDCQDTT